MNNLIPLATYCDKYHQGVKSHLADKMSITAQHYADMLKSTKGYEVLITPTKHLVVQVIREVKL